MKIGINLATVDWKGSFENLPLLFDEMQISEVEFPVQLWLQHRCSSEVLNSLNVCNVSGVLHRTEIFPESIFASQKIFEEQINQLDRKLLAVKDLKCPAMSLGIDPWVSLEIKEPEKVFLERVSYLASVLRKYNIILNLEYISHKIALPANQSKEGIFCASLTDALNLIEKLNMNSVMLLLDMIHWFADGMSLDPKELIDIVGLVHLCDYSNQDANSISDLNRLLPFEGSLPVNKFLSSLEKGGYKGIATIEVFRTKSYTPTVLQIKKAISKCREISHATL